MDICNLDLDIFALAKRNTRKRTFVTMTKRFLDTSLQFVPEITEESVTRFLETIWQTYRTYNVSYHNDMHSLDVA